VLPSGIATSAHRARLAELVPTLERVADADVPLLFGRGKALGAAQQQLAPALAQAREAQRLLGDVPGLRRIAERMDAAIGAAEASTGADPRHVARDLAAGLRRIDAELSPAAQRVDELFSRDASTWTSSEIEELRTIFLEGDEAARPPVFGGPHKYKETFDLRATLDYMARTHDATDIGMANRFAADWRLMRDSDVTRESLTRRVDELFARDASTWTTREIHDLRSIWNAPEELRPTAVGGPYKVKHETFTIQSALDWMTTTHDATDISVSNRFAVAWRVAGIDRSAEQVAAKVDEIFRRDAATWTTREIDELRTMLYDIPEELRPTHGPEQLERVNFRLAAGPKEEPGVRYTLREILDYMATTHDATDLQMSNMYAEAWLLASRDAKDEMLAALREHAVTGAPVTGPGGRTPTEVTVSMLKGEFLGDATGSERAARAASLLSFVNTRRETRALLDEVKDSLPRFGHASLEPLRSDALRLVDNNLRRMDGRVPAGEVRGMLNHARIDELGRIESLVRTLHLVEHPPAPAPSPAVVRAAEDAAPTPAVADALSW
jgi:hypothetical protein